MGPTPTNLSLHRVFGAPGQALIRTFTEFFTGIASTLGLPETPLLGCRRKAGVWFTVVCRIGVHDGSREHQSWLKDRGAGEASVVSR